MFIGRYVCTIKSERRIAVANFKVTENLVVRAVFFDDVNHVMNRIRSVLKRQSCWVGQELHLLLCDTRKCRQIFLDFSQIDASDRTVKQSWDIGMQPSAPGRHLGYIDRVWATAQAFAGGDQQIVIRDGHGQRIPFGGNEAHGGEGRAVMPMAFSQCCGVEHRDGIRRRAGREQPLSVFTLRQGVRFITREFLFRKVCREKRLNFSAACVDGGNGIGIGQGYV